MKHLCPDCRHEVEVIKACGCRDFFCNHCNQLVSKRRVIVENESMPLDKKTQAAFEESLGSR